MAETTYRVLDVLPPSSADYERGASIRYEPLGDYATHGPEAACRAAAEQHEDSGNLLIAVPLKNWHEVEVQVHMTRSISARRASRSSSTVAPGETREVAPGETREPAGAETG